MRPIWYGLMLGLVALSAPLAAQGSRRYCEYQAGTLAGAIDEARALGLSPGTVSVPQPLVRRRVRVVYTGAYRSTSRWSFELVAAYSMVAGIGRIYDYYLREVRLEEDGRAYWMLLPDDLRKQLRTSGHPGDTAVAFVDLAGAKVPPARSRDTTMWAFVLREIEVPDRAWFAALCGGPSDESGGPGQLPNKGLERTGAPAGRRIGRLESSVTRSLTIPIAWRALAPAAQAQSR